MGFSGEVAAWVRRSSRLHTIITCHRLLPSVSSHHPSPSNFHPLLRGLFSEPLAMHQLQDIKTKAKSSTLRGEGRCKRVSGGGAGESVGEGRCRRQHTALGTRTTHFKPVLNSSPVAEKFSLSELGLLVKQTQTSLVLWDTQKTVNYHRHSELSKT